MVFTNTLSDVTLSGPYNGQKHAQKVAAQHTAGKSFAEAAEINNIYQGNGLICQQQMCLSLTGCDSELGCPGHPDWNKVIDFCGRSNLKGLSMDGSYWQLYPANSQEQALTATKEATGLPVLPTAYNVTGMY
jgi:hypothetical protein